MATTRRQFLKASAAAGAGVMLSQGAGLMLNPALSGTTRALAAIQGPGLSDPALQPKFATAVPNALDPGFIYDTSKGSIKVGVGQAIQYTGLVAPDGMTPVPTTIWGYGDKKFYTWPGRTFQVRSYEPLEVKWENRLVDANGLPLPMPVPPRTAPGGWRYPMAPALQRPGRHPGLRRQPAPRHRPRLQRYSPALEARSGSERPRYRTGWPWQ